MTKSKGIATRKALIRVLQTAGGSAGRPKSGGRNSGLGIIVICPDLQLNYPNQGKTTNIEIHWVSGFGNILIGYTPSKNLRLDTEKKTWWLKRKNHLSNLYDSGGSILIFGGGDLYYAGKLGNKPSRIFIQNIDL